MEKERKKLSILSITIVLSVAAHVCFLLFLSLEPNYAHHSPDFSNEMMSPPIDITEVPDSLLQQKPEKSKPQPPPPSRKKFMEHAETEKLDNNEVDPNAQFWGAKNQKAEKELRAKEEAEFKAKRGAGEGSEEKKAEKTNTPQETSEFGETVVKKDWHKLNLQDLSMGGKTGLAGATNDYLENVEKSDRTVLSTREDKYFSYFYRIKQVLSQKWRTQLDYQMARLYRKGRSINEDQVVTSLFILLDEEGNVKKISKKESSGYEELDEAATAAFELAGPFPNPPKGIIDNDGFVRIDWNFILNIDGGPRLQFRTVGSAPVY